MVTKSRNRIVIGCAAVVTSLLVQAIPASAHITINTYGTTFTAGATNVVYFRVPHGCPDPDLVAQGFNARTNRVEVDIPATATGVKPEMKPGWNVAVLRAPVTNAVTRVIWTTTTNELPDWTFADFGLRATLNGVAGDVLEFPTTQYCDNHNDGTALTTPVSEAWIGANVPKLTLVGTASKISNAADLADLKNRVVTLESKAAAAITSIAALLSTDTSLDTRLASLESSLGSLSSEHILSVPLRAYDSRDAAGKINAGETRTVSLSSGKDGVSATAVALPAGATAAIVTLTVTETGAKAGYLKMYGASTPLPATSSINWSTGNQDIAVSTIVAVDASGQVKVTASGSTHFVVDVIGYLD